MLKGIPTCISPELLKVLDEMGHGDLLVIGDANFPGTHIAKEAGAINIRADGNRATELMDAILQLYPLDNFVETPVMIMDKSEQHKDLETPVWDEFEEIVSKYDERGKDAVTYIDRFDFYEKSKNAYCVLSTTETAFYACVILQKGCI